MIRRGMLVLLLLATMAIPVSAQLFGVVFDPENYANALLRYAQLQAQYAQLVTTYQQIRTQYLLLEQQSHRLPFDLDARYRSLPTPWLPFAADGAYGTTAGWILTANNGHEASSSYTQATQLLQPYGSALDALSAEEGARVRARYDRLQLTDASLTHGLEALGLPARPSDVRRANDSQPRG